MTSIMFVSSGVSFDAVGFVAEFRLSGVEIFEKGKRLRYGRGIHADSGFSYVLPATEGGGEVVDCIEKWIHSNERWLRELKRKADKSIFSVGLMVVSRDSFAPYFDLDAAHLSLLAALGIGISISAYPVSG